VPSVIAVGLSLYDIQYKAFDQELKANESQINALEAQNYVLKETQFDKGQTLRAN
jgi:hypothetical protein